jgi:hypothetical protein
LHLLATSLETTITTTTTILVTTITTTVTITTTGVEEEVVVAIAAAAYHRIANNSHILRHHTERARLHPNRHIDQRVVAGVALHTPLLHDLHTIMTVRTPARRTDVDKTKDSTTTTILT